MIVRAIKRLLKKNNTIFFILSQIIYWYLRIVYNTATWQFFWSSGYNKKKFLAAQGTIFTFWHNRLAFGPKILLEKTDVAALVSSHSDGKIISSVIKKFGFDVIEGSSNKKSIHAVREIINKLSCGQNVVITPDGPRGPRYRINSNITKIAKKYNAELIPIYCRATRYFSLNSWDQLIMPLPFTKIIVKFGDAINLGQSQKENDENLRQQLGED